MAAIKALQQWCRIQCEGYRDVDITNMTTSFRDGLAFCALIHKHRPDLINYDSLRKENIYDNNKLAFGVAEEKLGIPALLDAEDMVALKVPDRLSILTYVSQYYNYFHGRSPIGGMSGIKRPAEESKEEPSGKKSQPVIAKPFSPKPAGENRVPSASSQSSSPQPTKVSPKPARAAEQKNVLVDKSNKLGSLSSTCMVCKNHVHLVQRHLVDGKLYHRNCFRCKECSTILLSGTYKAGPEPGTFICTTHQKPVHGKPPYTGTPLKGPVLNKVASAWPAADSQRSPASQAAPENTKPSSTTPATKTWTPSTERTQKARERFFQSTPSTPASASTTSHWLPKGPVPTSVERAEDKSKSPIPITQSEGNSNNNNTFYRSGLRPADNRSAMSADIPSWKKDQNNPGITGLKHIETSPQTKGGTMVKQPLRSTSPKKESVRPSTVPNSKAHSGVSESPADWRSKLKPVSKGPKPADPGKPSLTSDTKTPNPPGNTSPVTPQSTASPRPTPAPAVDRRPPLPKASPNSSPGSWGFKNGKGSPDANTFKPEIHSPKNKADHIPNDEILKELQEIERNLNDLEKQGVELEKRLRRFEEQGEEDILMDDLMVDWFSLIRSKQVYMRRESELVYIAKTQDLEEQQPGVEDELRGLMEKPDHLKTKADRRREEELMEKLVEIVNDRNAIVEGLDEDRLREEEEDEQLDLMMKNLGKSDVKKSKSKKKSPMNKLFRWKSKDAEED